MNNFPLVILTALSLLLGIFFLEIWVFKPVKFPFFFRRNWRDRVRRDLGVSEVAWSNFTEEEKVFLRDVYITAKSYDVDFRINEGKRVAVAETALGVNARFSMDMDDQNGLLQVAIGGRKEEWMEELVHEFCHMEQRLSKPSKYGFSLCGGIDCKEAIKGWIDGKDLAEWELDKAVRSCIRLELERCKMAVEKVGRYGLCVDVDGYVRRSNSMIGFYGVARKRRRWYSISPKILENVWGCHYDVFLEEEDYFECRHCDIGVYDKHCLLSLEFYGSKG